MSGRELTEWVAFLQLEVKERQLIDQGLNPELVAEGLYNTDTPVFDVE